MHGSVARSQHDQLRYQLDLERWLRGLTVIVIWLPSLPWILLYYAIAATHEPGPKDGIRVSFESGLCGRLGSSPEENHPATATAPPQTTPHLTPWLKPRSQTSRPAMSTRAGGRGVGPRWPKRVTPS